MEEEPAELELAEDCYNVSIALLHEVNNKEYFETGEKQQTVDFQRLFIIVQSCTMAAVTFMVQLWLCFTCVDFLYDYTNVVCLCVVTGIPPLFI